MTTSKKILITFGRSFLALELARQLHNAGHQVFLADSIRTYVAKFSNTVKKCYKVPSPRFYPSEYVASIQNIVHQEKIDLLLPIYEETSQLSYAKDFFPSWCTLFCPSFDLYETLHNKWTFQAKLQELGIEPIKSYLIQTQEDLNKVDFHTPYALKLCYSRASQGIKKVFPNEAPPLFEITPSHPWIAQEWLEGKKFCTYSICHEGQLYAHAVYPVNYAIDGNSCLIFESIEHPGIKKWIKNFIKKVNYTGQIAFDFIETQDGKLYAIECNPRATSGVMLFDKTSGLDQAFFQKNKELIFPQPKARRQIATGMLLYGWRKSALPNNNFFKFITTFCTTKDVVFKRSDIKPFLFEPLVFVSILKNSLKSRLPIPVHFTYDHDWNGEKFAIEK